LWAQTRFQEIDAGRVRVARRARSGL